MANKLHTLTQQELTDDNMFGQGSSDIAGLACPQDPLATFAASAAVGSTKPTALPPTALYLTEKGDTTAISVDDIHQGQMGDCFLLSSFGEEALFHPTAITNMIHDNGNGTETVTLHIAKNGYLPTFGTTSFKAIGVTINNTFPSNSVDSGSGQDMVGTQKEIWPQVIEKAVATLNGGYATIANGGYPVIAMEELTGQAASAMATQNLNISTLESDIAAGDLLTFDTSSSQSLPYGLFGDHAYMFQKLNAGATPTIQLANPWGFDQPLAIPINRLFQAGIVQIDIGHTG